MNEILLENIKITKESLDGIANSFYTNLTVRSQVYLEKVIEAEGLINDSNFIAPLLTREAALRNVDVIDLAMLILEKRDQAKQVLTEMEILRTDLNLFLDSETDEDKIRLKLKDTMKKAKEIYSSI